MTMRRLIAVVVALVAPLAAGAHLDAQAAQAPAPAPFTVTEIRVHGNHTTPEPDIVALSGLSVGAEITDADVVRASERLRASSHFDDVEVRVRSRSIADPAQIAVIIIVRERAGVTPDLLIDRAPSPLRRLRSSTMVLPILDYEDGYGLTYGARVSFVNPLGGRSRLSMPGSWGGTRRIAAELEKSFGAGPFSSARASAALSQREHPFYEIDERRYDVDASVRRRLGVVSVAALGGWSDVEFGEWRDRYTTIGAEADLDTRTDPTFPRNAIFARGRVRWLNFDSPPAGLDEAPVDDSRSIRRMDGVAQVFIRFVGSSVIAVGGRIETADASLPPYLASMLGGTGAVRGFPVGYDVGDKLWASSIELRVPLSRATRVGRVGVRAFADTGAVAAFGSALADAPRRTGVGAGVFTQASLLQLGADVAYGIDRGWRLHLVTGVRF